MTEVGSFFLFILQTFFVGKEGDIPFFCRYLLVEIDHLRNIGNELFEAFGVHYLLAFQPIRKFHHRFLSHAVDE